MLGGTPSNYTMRNTLYKCVGTVRSVGIIPYKYKVRKRARRKKK